ncbi:MAG TPA: choice-of-anchor B family protein [Longimicrobiales bacterium]|nr:choice-of-anchor B family protein [Longimicrobiales bacterium]
MSRRSLIHALLALSLAGSAASASAQEPNFGRSVAMTGAELFVGQPVNWYGPGVVYTYRLDAGGMWQERSLLTASDSSRMDDFGRALAVDGNTLVVGAPRKRDGAGVAYVFGRADDAAGWREVVVLEAPAGEDPAEFAAALSLSGDDLLVGSPAASGTGAVHHYRREGGRWSPVGALRPGADALDGGFGVALDRSGEWLLVGAPAADSARGRVYAARRLDDGAWSEPRPVPLPPEADQPGARAGSAVLVDGRRAYVGAPGAAAVVVLELGPDGGWASAGVLRPGTEERGTRFGSSLAAGGGDVWVGAPGVNRGDGRVYRFAPAASGEWAPAAELGPDATVGASWPMGFGYAMAVAGDRAVVGMPSRDFGEGRAMSLAQYAGDWTQTQLLDGRIFSIGAGLTPGARCEDGWIGEFPCTGMEVVAHLPVSALGGERGVWVNDVWGWTDPETNRDYALVARRDGASFVDVTDPSAPRVVGNLPRTLGSRPSVWRDIKVIGSHAYVVADGAGAHGMQVFDLTRLRDTGDELVDFAPDTTYHEIFSAHNVVADTASGFLYIVGANSGGETCGGGLHMVDARDPERPVFAGCYNDATNPNSRGYTHDAQCVVYHGPDQRYRGRQICVGSNEAEINIADVTDKANPVTLGRMSYPNVAYAHQGWFDDEQRYFYQNDELDELAGTVAGTRTLVWDLSQLDDPMLVNEYIGPVPASDHNLFVVGDRMYQSNYGSGLRVLDISDRANPREIAFFDSAPYNNDEPGHSAGQSGAWSNYPFFRNGVVIFTSVREGLFIVRVTPPVT